MSSASSQIAFRYRSHDGAMGLSRSTAKRLAEMLAVDETQMIHMALQEFARKHLPQYAPDDGPLSPEHMSQLQQKAPKLQGGTVRSHLFDGV
jgi:hypothetical protein